MAKNKKDAERGARRRSAARPAGGYINPNSPLAKPAPRNSDGSWPTESCTINDPTTGPAASPRARCTRMQAGQGGRLQAVRLLPPLGRRRRAPEGPGLRLRRGRGRLREPQRHRRRQDVRRQPRLVLHQERRPARGALRHLVPADLDARHRLALLQRRRQPGRRPHEPRTPVHALSSPAVPSHEWISTATAVAGPRCPATGGLAAFLVFLASGAVLVLETVALRLVGPYVGVTLQVTSSVIGIALAAIAYGAWLGGWLADQRDPRRLLAPALVLAGIATAVTLPIVRYAGEALRGGAVSGDPAARRAGGLRAGAAALRGHPAGGQAPARRPAQHRPGGRPAVQHRHARRGHRDAGHRLRPGRRAAQHRRSCSALGGRAGRRRPRRSAATCAGTTAPRCPARPGPGALLAVRRAGRRRAVRGGADPVRRGDGVPLRGGRRRTRPRDSGRVLLLNSARHSYVDLADPTHLEFAYTKWIGAVADVVAPAGQPLDALHLGGGGFTDAALPDGDPAGHATTWCSRSTASWSSWTSGSWAYAPGPTLRASVGDARMLIGERADGERRPGGRRRVRAPGGAVAPGHPRDGRPRSGGSPAPAGIYVQNVIDYPPLRFIRAEVATVAAEFPHVALVAPPERAGRRAGLQLPHRRVARAAAAGRGSGPAWHPTTAAGRSPCWTGAELDDFVGDARVADRRATPRSTSSSPPPDRSSTGPRFGCSSLSGQHAPWVAGHERSDCSVAGTGWSSGSARAACPSSGADTTRCSAARSRSRCSPRALASDRAFRHRIRTEAQAAARLLPPATSPTCTTTASPDGRPSRTW